MPAVCPSAELLRDSFLSREPSHALSMVFGGTYGVVRLDEGVIAGYDVDVVVLDADVPVSSARAASRAVELTHCGRRCDRYGQIR